MLQDLPVAAAIATSNLQRARQFYEGVLGLKSPRETPDGVQYECGGSTGFLLYQSGFAGTAKNTVLGWRADNFDTVIGGLQARGVVFVE